MNSSELNFLQIFSDFVYILEESVAAPPWSSLEDIPRLSSGMLLHSSSCGNNNNNSKTEKVSPKKTLNAYRKISVSDQHLEFRSNPGIVPNFLQLSSASSYRESCSYREVSKRSELNGSGFSQSDRLGSRRMSLGTVLERRDRKNGVAGLLKYERWKQKHNGELGCARMQNE